MFPIQKSAIYSNVKKSRNQNRGSCGFTTFEVLMGPGSLGKRVCLSNLDPDRTFFHNLEQIMGMGKQVFTPGCIGHKARSCKE